MFDEVYTALVAVRYRKENHMNQWHTSDSVDIRIQHFLSLKQLNKETVRSKRC